MRAVGMFEFGGFDVLRVVDVPAPQPGRGEVRIRVAAAAVNPVDLSVRSGKSASRYAGFIPPYILGMDAAGTVDSLGEETEGLAIGDRVMGAVSIRAEGGAQCELLVLPADLIAPAPAGISIEEAATLPMNGLTAFEALRMLDLSPGDSLMVTGGAGWLATIALAVAKARGIRTIADADPAERELVHGNGADRVVDRGPGLAERILALEPGGVDGALDTALLGASLLPAIREGGGWAAVRDIEPLVPERGIVRHLVGWPRYPDPAGALRELGALVSDGPLRPRVEARFPPERAADAHIRQEAGKVRGRLVITF